MRVSSDAFDEGYADLSRSFRVYLDGVEVKRVITADEERGYVICIVDAKNDQLAIVEKRGVVKVVEECSN